MKDNDDNDSKGGILQTPKQNWSKNNEPLLHAGILNDSILVNSTKKGIKRKKCPKKWKRNIQKPMRNTGKMYKMHTKEDRNRAERKIKPPCDKKCRLKCSQKFNEEERKNIFALFWELDDVGKQRQFIAHSMKRIKPLYIYVRTKGNRVRRRLNNAFYFYSNNKKIRVCKLFFKNTLDINDRPISTVLKKKK